MSLRLVSVSFALLVSSCALAVGPGTLPDASAPPPDARTDATPDAPATPMRACGPNCTFGHRCCAGSCAGPAVATPGDSDCCTCLPGEVSSASCPRARCGP